MDLAAVQDGKGFGQYRAFVHISITAETGISVVGTGNSLLHTHHIRV
jgi:hypothetical protein